MSSPHTQGCRPTTWEPGIPGGPLPPAASLCGPVLGRLDRMLTVDETPRGLLWVWKGEWGAGRHRVGNSHCQFRSCSEQPPCSVCFLPDLSTCRCRCRRVLEEALVVPLTCTRVAVISALQLPLFRLVTGHRSVQLCGAFPEDEVSSVCLSVLVAVGHAWLLSLRCGYCGRGAECLTGWGLHLD